MKSPPSLKRFALLGVSLVVLLAYGTSSYAESLGDEAARAALARKADMDAEAKERKAEEARKEANALAAAEKKKEADRKAANAKAAEEREKEAARIAKLQTQCEKNGGDWQRGKCVMPPPPEPTPKPKPAPIPEPVVVAEPPVAPVRQAQPATTAHYRINGDGTVTDTQRGLMWKQCSEGQSGSGCSGTVATYKWDDALSRFGSGVSFAGYSDWRIPTKDELKSLVYCSNGTPTPLPDRKWCSEDGKRFQSPTINQQAFPNTPEYGWYWSSTAKGASGAWFVGFASGGGYWLSRDFDGAVRLVRSGQ